MNVEFERRVVALFGVVEVNKEEDVSPDVVLVVYVMLKALQHIHEGYAYCLIL